jgi:hypothetical protein
MATKNMILLVLCFHHVYNVIFFSKISEKCGLIEKYSVLCRKK